MMRITPVKLQKQNALIDDYRGQQPRILEHFDYNPYNETTYQTRARELQYKQIDREQLADTLVRMNKRWDAPEAVYRNIDRLRQDDSVVVIGGQQAGVLTGPMYTINKIISIIQFAKDQEAKLQIPVIPVFWIAGEDHDFDEVNHIYLHAEKGMEKCTLPQQITEKSSVSNITIDQKVAAQWLDRIFEQLTETEHTKHLHTTVHECLRHSDTYVDFFARVVNRIFNEEGVVLADSADSGMRELERHHFAQLINKQREISSGVHQSLQQLNQKGYSISLDTEPNEAHLFYHEDNNRILLTRDDEGNWIGKQREVLLTTDEMLETANHHPSRLSNNVVTRPIMQELLFPTLAFIGGPGEIGYWSALKPAFHAVNMHVPPVLPRLSLTLLDRQVEKLMDKYGITYEFAVNHGTETVKAQWLASQSAPPVEQIASEVRQAVANAHKPLREVARDTRSDIGELADKNLYYLNQQINYLEQRIMKTFEEKYAGQLHEFDIIHHHIHPSNGLQERIWNPLFWMNLYGDDIIKRILQHKCSFEDEHHVVSL